MSLTLFYVSSLVGRKLSRFGLVASLTVVFLGCDRLIDRDKPIDPRFSSSSDLVLGLKARSWIFEARDGSEIAISPSGELLFCTDARNRLLKPERDKTKIPDDTWVMLNATDGSVKWAVSKRLNYPIFSNDGERVYCVEGSNKLIALDALTGDQVFTHVIEGASHLCRPLVTNRKGVAYWLGEGRAIWQIDYDNEKFTKVLDRASIDPQVEFVGESHKREVLPDYQVDEAGRIYVCVNWRLWCFDAESKKVLWHVRFNTGADCLLLPKDEILVDANVRDGAFVLDSLTGEVLRRFPTVGYDSNNGPVNNHSPWIATHEPRPGNFADHLSLMDPREGKVLGIKSPATNEFIYSLSLSHDGLTLATCEVNGRVQVWDIHKLETQSKSSRDR